MIVATKHLTKVARSLVRMTVEVACMVWDVALMGESVGLEVPWLVA